MSARGLFFEGIQTSRMSRHTDLAALAAITDEALIGTDARGIVTEWNAAAERLLGYPAQEIIGRSFSIIATVPDADADAAHAIAVVGRRNDDEVLLLSLSIARMQSADGAPAGAVRRPRRRRHGPAVSAGTSRPSSSRATTRS